MQEGKLVIAFEDGVERKLLEGGPGLIELTDDVPEELEATLPPPKPDRMALRHTRPSVLIKSFRLALRDGLMAAQADGAYPDDELIEMQKGLSRITADHARFLGSKASTVRNVKAETARALHLDPGVEQVFEELAERLRERDEEAYHQWSRAYDEPADAAEAVGALLPLVQKAAHLSDDEIETLRELLTPEDRKKEPTEPA